MTTLSGTDETAVYRVDNGGFTQLGAAITQNFATGEKLGLEAIGSTIAVYRFASAVWSQLSTRSDSTYTTAGKIGMFCDNTTTKLDDFGGGTVVAAGVVVKRLAAQGVG
jgi:hypothetical protein